MILNKKQILERINKENPMVDNIKDINSQIQPAGLDLTVNKIYEFESSGCLDFDNSKRELSKKQELSCDYNFVKDRYYLEPGSYQIELNEIFNIPLDILAFTIPRSSSQRCGSTIENGYFEPGFKGNGFSLFVVSNPHGIYIYKYAKICQMIFHTTEETESYNGIYNEDLNKIR